MDGFKRPFRPAAPQQKAADTLDNDRRSDQNTPHEITPVTQPVAMSQPSQPLHDEAPAQNTSQNPALSTPTQAPSAPLKVSTVRKRKMPWILLGVIVLLVAGALTANAWYQTQLKPVDPNSKSTQDVQVNQGATLSFVSGRLQERGLIRSSLAFQVYAQSVGKQSALQAGTCRLAPSQSTAEILDELTKGCNEFKIVTFYPGGTIEKPVFKPVGSTIVHDKYVKLLLKKAGYSDDEIAAALSAKYTGPLFAGKPDGTTLEGYIYGETYHVAPKATANEVLQASFDQMYSVVKSEDLIAKYKALNLDLYQGITLASIVQKELNCEDKPTPERKATCYEYQQKIASVFINRLKSNMPLGSDSTFIYAADMTGQPATSKIDSKYNTYKVAGLPPGPIASPGALALKATANPAQSDALYFVAGDDGLIYFSRTQAEHEANTAKYCKKLCAY